MPIGLESWTLARPEIFLAAATVLLLLYGVLRGEVATAFISVATAVALLVTAVLLFAPYREGTAFAGLFITDRLTATMKALVLVGAAISVLMSRTYFERAKAWRFEYPILVSLATLGMMLMISANDLMALYVGLELQSLALYVVAAFQRDSIRSTEAPSWISSRTGGDSMAASKRFPSSARAEAASCDLGMVVPGGPVGGLVCDVMFPARRPATTVGKHPGGIRGRKPV